MRAGRDLVVLALCLSPLTAAAGPARKAPFLQRYEDGLRLYKEERYSEAIVAFKEAYALKQLPRVLFNIGQAHLKLGDAQEALRMFERYLQMEPDAPPEIKSKVDSGMAQARARLEALRADAPPPTQPTTTPPPGEAARSQPDPPTPTEVQKPPAPPDQPASGPAPPEDPPPGEAAQRIAPPAATPAVAEPAPLSRPPAPVRLERAQRPVWRLATGGVLLAGGAALLGFGGGALAVDGQCIDSAPPPMKSCHFDYATGSLGLGLLIGGAVAVGAGALLVAWPGARRPVSVAWRRP